MQLVYLPVCLNWGYLCLLQVILSGSRAVLLERFSAKAALDLIQREGVTYIATAPASIVAMLNEPDLSDYDVSSLRVVITGGASAAIETIRDYQARMPGHLIELYGMLETGFHTYTRFSDDPGKSQRHDRTSGLEHGLEDPRRGGQRGGARRGGRDRGARVPACILATTPMPRPTPRHSRPTAGSAPAISGASSMRPATSRSSGAARRSSIAEARSSFRARWRRSSTRIPRSCMRPWSASPIARLGERNCLCVIPKAGQAVTLAETGRASQRPGGRLQAARGAAHRRGAAVHGDRQTAPARPAERIAKGQVSASVKAGLRAFAAGSQCVAGLLVVAPCRAPSDSLSPADSAPKAAHPGSEHAMDHEARFHAPGRAGRRRCCHRRLAQHLDQRPGASRRRHQDRHAARLDRAAGLRRPAAKARRRVLRQAAERQGRHPRARRSSS